ncbi:hypothetical protein HYPSUDRAFT_44268 [Hypholoma sublateritium FD-334 SS-4]|uniref:Nucleoporin Nup54 alpha-helical domain-containing protein n=1 Tax=Hypholoma sublateritium (strain FD-334 SS-4) TaxID=945553 RepID=A0A0D2KY95_HYPSF|nr:hypothetical protein HYPSUDRAFT_44268 [Hypholoma sublateritium FD-334 SS-4]
MAFNSGSIFGAKPAGSNIFGSTTQPQQNTGFGNTAATGQTQPQQASNIFGSFGQNTQQPQQNTQQPQQTNIFGQPQQPQQQTNLFGQPQQQPQQQQPQQQGGNLFGGSLFGSNTQQPQQQQQQQQPQQGAFGTAFGGQSTTQQGFGSTGATGGFGFGGGSNLFGSKSQAPQQQQQQSATPGQNIGFGGLAQSAVVQSNVPPPFTNKTKFNDLPDQMKTILEGMDSFIQGRVQISKDIQQRKLGDEPMKGKEAIRNLHKDLVNTATTIRNDLHLTQDLKDKVDQAVEDTIVATRIIDGFRNPQSGNTYLKDHADFPMEYFIRVGDQMKKRLAWYKSTIEQIERKLASTASSTQTPQSISATLQAQHATFLALASKTAAVDVELQKLKAVYAQLWRSKTGSVRDPFNDGVKPAETGNDFGLGGLHVR